MYKQLDEENLEVLTVLINDIWFEEEPRSKLCEAYIASLFKKGDSDNPINYRPISLLNIIYKIYASLIQIRLANKIDKHIQETQFGFRRNRSTAQAFYIARRILDIGAESNENIVMVFLDCEKAFNTIDQKKLIEALKRFNVPEKMIRNIAAINKEPKFKGRRIKRKAVRKE